MDADQVVTNLATVLTLLRITTGILGITAIINTALFELVSFSEDQQLLKNPLNALSVQVVILLLPTQILIAAFMWTFFWRKVDHCNSCPQVG
ncbi:hypothetical protein N7478_004331 [Penicillium angulare]|uniref:uncharacterized protein n=1 Tax=Penicillium angulare TaxID=116970 RepID=UPI002542118F|nr:uncharacterized protein N7478_004331 [Penicillium angulare]KAJ5278959.1 hypothetical protein N7478_004331 [Penicillium angulare]